MMLVESNGHFALAADAWRIPRRDTEALFDAIQLLERANRISAQAEDRAEAAAETARTEGFAVGLTAGRVHAEAICTEATRSLARAIDSLEEQRRRETVDLALAIVRRLTRGPLQHEFVVAAIRAAYDELAQEQPLSIRVHPDIAKLLTRSPTPLPGGVRVIEDAAMAPTGCLFETSEALIDASVDAQLDALERSAPPGRLLAE